MPRYKSTTAGVELLRVVGQRLSVPATVTRAVEDVKSRADVSLGVTAACFTVFDSHSSLNDMQFSNDGAVVRHGCLHWIVCTTTAGVEHVA
jgi:hypothetical protein